MQTGTEGQDRESYTDTQDRDNYTARHDEPRAWVGCLGCYNAGELNGEWLYGTDAAELAAEAVEVDPETGACLVCGSDELWVFDHEGYHGLITGECSPAEAQRLAELLESFGDDAPAFAAYARGLGDASAAAEMFEEAYMGRHDSERAYAEELAEELVMPQAYREDDPLVRYFDYDAWTRDLFIGDYFSEPAPGGTVYVFRVQ